MRETHYRSIKTTSLRRWIDCQDNDFTSLRINPKKGTKQTDSNAYEDLMNEYIATFGFSEDFNRLREKRIDLGLLQIEYLKDAMTNRKLLNDINALKVEIKAMFDKIKQGEGGVIDAVTELRKQGLQIDEEKYTIYSFEKLVRSYGK
jgi:hypothetical protein